MRLRLLAATVLFAAAPATPASAVCAGTVNTFIVCTDPTGGPVVYSDCVVIGSPPCIPVVVHAPASAVDCGLFDCDPILCPLYPELERPPFVVMDGEDVHGVIENDCPPYEV